MFADVRCRQRGKGDLANADFLTVGGAETFQGVQRPLTRPLRHVDGGSANKEIIFAPEQKPTDQQQGGLITVVEIINEPDGRLAIMKPANKLYQRGKHAFSVGFLVPDLLPVHLTEMGHDRGEVSSVLLTQLFERFLTFVSQVSQKNQKDLRNEIIRPIKFLRISCGLYLVYRLGLGEAALDRVQKHALSHACGTFRNEKLVLLLAERLQAFRHRRERRFAAPDSRPPKLV